VCLYFLPSARHDIHLWLQSQSTASLSKLDLKDNQICGADAGKALGDVLAVNTVLNELDLSDQGEAITGHMRGKGALDASFVRAFAVGLKKSKTLSHLNVSSNNLGDRVPPEGWIIKDHGCSWQKYIHWDGREQMNAPKGTSPAALIALARAVKDMGGLSKLLLTNNRLLTAEAGEILSDMVAANPVLKELDVSGNNWSRFGGWEGDGPGFANTLSVGLRNGTLSLLNLSNNDLGGCYLGEVGGYVSDVSGMIHTHRMSAYIGCLLHCCLHTSRGIRLLFVIWL
jgi:hypothetical protein